jgi:hypothetical protein
LQPLSQIEGAVAERIERDAKTFSKPFAVLYLDALLTLVIQHDQLATLFGQPV